MCNKCFFVRAQDQTQLGGLEVELGPGLEEQLDDGWVSVHDRIVQGVVAKAVLAVDACAHVQQ